MKPMMKATIGMAVKIIIAITVGRMVGLASLERY
jgi:hypothetical protein